MARLLSANPTSQMRRMMEAWLKSTRWDTREVIRWLEGYGLPPVGFEDEPYQWLLRGVAAVDHSGTGQHEFARRVAKILLNKPDVERPGERPDQVLYNLFMLAAALRIPQHLAKPLRGVLRRRALEGKWQGIDLRNALFEAIVRNQMDSTLEKTWMAMIKRQSHPFLPGNEEDAFGAVVHMPAFPDAIGLPNMDAIATGLKLAAELYEKEDRAKFRHLVLKATNAYPAFPSWDEEVIIAADRHEWSKWAVVSVPTRLWVEHAANGSIQVLSWKPIVDLIRLAFPAPSAVTELRTLCDGVVLRATLHKKCISFGKEIADQCEWARCRHNFSLASATDGLVIELYQHAERWLQVRNQTSNASMVAEARKALDLASRLPVLH